MRTWWLAFFVLVSAIAVAPRAYAHEVRPGYLQLRQTAEETYDILWKVPGRGDMRLGLDVVLPEGSVNLASPRGVFAGEAFTESWRFKRRGGLAGTTIRIAGLTATLTDVLVRLERLDGTTQVTRLSASQPSFIVEDAPSRVEVAQTYLLLGIEHILGGIDHLLFVLALLFLARGWRRVLATVTAFTVAHSLTLAAATLGFVHVPQRPVEAVIALSIVFVAAEILRLNRRPAQTRESTRILAISSVSAHWPWIVAFTFGLLHGFGFAGALSEVGLPQNAIPVALLFFNVGVEIGQLLFIAGVFAVVTGSRVAMRHLFPAQSSRLPNFVRAFPAYAIGSIAMFWVIQRIVAF